MQRRAEMPRPQNSALFRVNFRVVPRIL